VRLLTIAVELRRISEGGIGMCFFSGADREIPIIGDPGSRTAEKPREGSRSTSNERRFAQLFTSRGHPRAAPTL